MHLCRCSVAARSGSRRLATGASGARSSAAAMWCATRRLDREAARSQRAHEPGAPSRASHNATKALPATPSAVGPALISRWASHQPRASLLRMSGGPRVAAGAERPGPPPSGVGEGRAERGRWRRDRPSAWRSGAQRCCGGWVAPEPTRGGRWPAPIPVRGGGGRDGRGVALGATVAPASTGVARPAGRISLCVGTTACDSGVPSDAADPESFVREGLALAPLPRFCPQRPQPGRRTALPGCSGVAGGLPRRSRGLRRGSAVRRPAAVPRRGGPVRRREIGRCRRPAGCSGRAQGHGPRTRRHPPATSGGRTLGDGARAAGRWRRWEGWRPSTAGAAPRLRAGRPRGPHQSPGARPAAANRTWPEGAPWWTTPPVP